MPYVSSLHDLPGHCCLSAPKLAAPWTNCLALNWLPHVSSLHELPGHCVFQPLNWLPPVSSLHELPGAYSHCCLSVLESSRSRTVEGSHYAFSTPEDWFNEAHCLNYSTVFRKTGKGEPEVLQCRVRFQWIHQVVLCGGEREGGLGFKLWCGNFGCKLVVYEFILGYFGNLIKFYIYASYGAFWASYSHGFNFAETRRRSSSAVSLTLRGLAPRCRWQINSTYGSMPYSNTHKISSLNELNKFLTILYNQ